MFSPHNRAKFSVRGSQEFGWHQAGNPASVIARTRDAPGL
jgi:hypothetical protein